MYTKVQLTSINTTNYLDQVYLEYVISVMSYSEIGFVSINFAVESQGLHGSYPAPRIVRTIYATAP